MMMMMTNVNNEIQYDESSLFVSDCLLLVVHKQLQRRQ
jgi:hypothetical protein